MSGGPSSQSGCRRQPPHLGRHAPGLVLAIRKRTLRRGARPPEPLGCIVTEPVYLTPAEVALILRVHPRTITRLAQQDATMPAAWFGKRLVRFEKAALDRWLARKRPRLAQGSAQAGDAAV